MRIFKLKVFLFAIFLGYCTAHLWEISSEFQSLKFDKGALQSWKVENFGEDFVATCGDRTLVGGFNVAGRSIISKNFKSPVKPTSITVSFELYLIDKWNTGWETNRDNDQIIVKINDVVQQLMGSTYDRQVHSQSSNICGKSQYKDRKTRVTFTLPYNSNQFSLSIEGNFQNSKPDLVSWGIRDLKIYAEYSNSNSLVVVKELSDNNSFGEKNWQIKGGNGTPKQNCGSYTLLGGPQFSYPGTTFIRTISNLPSHTFITIKFMAFFIDTNDANDSIIIYLDNQIVHEFVQNTQLNAVDLCGVGKNKNSNWDLMAYGEIQQNVYIRVPHNSPKAEIKIFVNTDQNPGDESFGFRDFQIEVSSPCPILYSQPNGQGNSFQFCGNIPDLKQEGWQFPIRGIYVPEGLKITVFKDSNYEGKKFRIEKTNLNLTGQEYVLINQAFRINIKEEGKRLRNNKQ